MPKPLTLEEIQTEIQTRKCAFFDGFRAKAQHELQASAIGEQLNKISQDIATYEAMARDAQKEPDAALPLPTPKQTGETSGADLNTDASATTPLVPDALPLPKSKE